MKSYQDKYLKIIFLLGIFSIYGQIHQDSIFLLSDIGFSLPDHQTFLDDFGKDLTSFCCLYKQNTEGVFLFYKISIVVDFKIKTGQIMLVSDHCDGKTGCFESVR